MPAMTRTLTPDNRSPDRESWNWQDALLLILFLTGIAALVTTAGEFKGAYDPQFKVSLELWNLPAYTLQTLLRMLAGFLLSLTFSISYASLAYYNRLAGMVLLPLLDILQSIPVLSFLPAVMLTLINLVPGSRIGIELAAVLLIFTGMAWNLAFSFYQSLTGVPRELREAALNYRLSPWQNFWMVDLPAGTIGLIWNSIMSVAGGWFFLIAIESFTLGSRNFQLPGLGSFLATAASQQNYRALVVGLGVLIGIIVLTDLLIWRPLIAWGDRFKFELSESDGAELPVVLELIRRSALLRRLDETVIKPLEEWFDRRFIRPREEPATKPGHRRRWAAPLLLGLGALWLAYLLPQVLHLLQGVSGSDWARILQGGLWTSLRVAAALTLSLLWTIPVGVAIGRSPELARVLQPLVQIAASIPATALFPVLMIALASIGGGLEIGSVLLMMLGTMWYLLFNIIAGAQAIPSEMVEAAEVFQLSRLQRWTTLILPALFPYLITGIVTAVGGAWNASIVSEYLHFHNRVLATPGLGSLIAEASEHSQMSLLFAATMVMALIVVATNRLVWRRLYHLAEERFRLL